MADLLSTHVLSRNYITVTTGVLESLLMLVTFFNVPGINFSHAGDTLMFNAKMKMKRVCFKVLFTAF